MSLKYKKVERTPFNFYFRSLREDLVISKTTEIVRKFVIVTNKSRLESFFEIWRTHTAPAPPVRITSSFDLLVVTSIPIPEWKTLTLGCIITEKCPICILQVTTKFLKWHNLYVRGEGNQTVGIPWQVSRTRFHRVPYRSRVGDTSRCERKELPVCIKSIGRFIGQPVLYRCPVWFYGPYGSYKKKRLTRTRDDF